MTEDPYRDLLLAGATVIGASMLWIGLRVLALRRPFVIRSVWLTGLILVGVTSLAAPGLIEGVGSLWPLTDVSAIVLGWSLLMVFMASLAAVRFRGFLTFGTTATTARDALFAGLRQLDLKFTESLSAVDLPEHRSRIEVAIEGWMGTAQLRSRDFAGKRLLPAIARQMNQYFRTTTVPLALTSCVSYAAFGGTLLGIVAFVLAA